MPGLVVTGLQRVPRFWESAPVWERQVCADVSEFASSLAAGTIANLHDPAVQRVLKSRTWPSTYVEYETMMDEAAAKPVNFTAKGDREVVAQLFFKLVYSITGAAVPQGPESASANFSSQLPRLSMWSKPSAGPAGSALDSSDIDAAAWWKAAAAANAIAPPRPRPRARSAPRAPRDGPRSMRRQDCHTRAQTQDE